MFLTQKFAAFIAGLTCEKLPPEAISQAKERIMDTVGAALAGRGNWEYARNLEQVGLSLGTGDYSIIGAPGRRFPWWGRMTICWLCRPFPNPAPWRECGSDLPSAARN